MKFSWAAHKNYEAQDTQKDKLLFLSSEKMHKKKYAAHGSDRPHWRLSSSPRVPASGKCFQCQQFCLFRCEVSFILGHQPETIGRKRDLDIQAENRACHAAKMNLEFLCNTMFRRECRAEMCNQLQVAAFQISRAETDLTPGTIASRAPAFKGPWPPRIAMRKRHKDHHFSVCW